MSQATSQPTGPEEDFTVRYQWKEASLPPPHHFEYTIVIGPEPHGTIEYWPDYPSPETPSWIETFDLRAEELRGVLELACEADLESDEHKSEVRVGGTIEILETRRDGQTLRLDLDTESGRQLADAVKSLVPETIWRRLEEKRQRLAKEHAHMN